MIQLLALAVAPGLAISLFIYLMDEHEKEPLKLLVVSFIYGLLSIVVTLLITVIIEQFLPVFNEILVDEFIHAFFGVALVEEFSKFIFLILFLYPSREFNEPFDGIVYAVMIGMGFATLENIFYVVDGGLEVAWLRMFTAVPAHATFAILMGYFVGLAKIKHKTKAFGLIGLIAATILHGFYDYFLFISHIPGIYVWSLVSLIAGVWLSMKAMTLHSDASPFKRKLKGKKI